jgi:hypothetical protein
MICRSCRYLNFVPRGFGRVHHSIAILYHQVPNPNMTIRHFCIAVGGVAVRAQAGVQTERRRGGGGAGDAGLIKFKPSALETGFSG